MNATTPCGILRSAAVPGPAACVLRLLVAEDDVVSQGAVIATME